MTSRCPRLGNFLKVSMKHLLLLRVLRPLIHLVKGVYSQRIQLFLLFVLCCRIFILASFRRPTTAASKQNLQQRQQQQQLTKRQGPSHGNGHKRTPSARSTPSLADSYEEDFEHFSESSSMASSTQRSPATPKASILKPASIRTVQSSVESVRSTSFVLHCCALYRCSPVFSFLHFFLSY